jgi:hypothetical protein
LALSIASCRARRCRSISLGVSSMEAVGPGERSHEPQKRAHYLAPKDASRQQSSVLIDRKVILERCHTWLLADLLRAMPLLRRPKSSARSRRLRSTR